MIPKIKIPDYNNIVVLTGAGISVASGLNTYRGIGSEGQISKTSNLAHVDRLKDNPMAIWQVFNPLRRDCLQAQPNQAHLTLADLEKQIKPQQNFILITQNVDGLHSKAGNKNVVQLHEQVDQTNCSNSQCNLESFLDNQTYLENCPKCPGCNSPLKPDVVLFGDLFPLMQNGRLRKH